MPKVSFELHEEHVDPRSDEVAYRLTVKNEGLKAYLDALVKRLAPAQSPDIRVHTVRKPLFNAMMAPNGTRFGGWLLNTADNQGSRSHTVPAGRPARWR